MKRFLTAVAVLLVVLNLKGNAKPFVYEQANGVAIIAAEDGSVKVLICRDGKPQVTVPLELIDALTVECNREVL